MELPIEPEYDQHDLHVHEDRDLSSDIWFNLEGTTARHPSKTALDQDSEQDPQSREGGVPVQSTHDAAVEVQPEIQEPASQANGGISHLVRRLRENAVRDGLSSMSTKAYLQPWVDPMMDMAESKSICGHTAINLRLGMFYYRIECRVYKDSRGL